MNFEKPMQKQQIPKELKMTDKEIAGMVENLGPDPIKMVQEAIEIAKKTGDERALDKAYTELKKSEIASKSNRELQIQIFKAEELIAEYNQKKQKEQFRLKGVAGVESPAIEISESDLPTPEDVEKMK